MKANKKFILSLFFIVVFGPVLVAYYFVNKKGPLPFPTSHHGKLISPVQNIQPFSFYDFNNQPFPAQNLFGKWYIIYISPENCQETCYDTLYNMRQIRTALGKDSSRLERLFITHPQCETGVCEQYLSEAYPDMQKLKIEKSDYPKIFQKWSDLSERELLGEIYIMDPKGNIMMQYSAEEEPRKILSDLKRLLKTSHA